MKRLYRRLRYELSLVERSSVSVEQAQKNIDDLRYQPYPVFGQKNTLNIQSDLMIVIPVYNVERFLDECLQSVLNQKTKYSFSVVVVDDGSTDGSGRLLDHYADQRTITVIHQKNRGQSGARNRALETITGRYVMFLDADDYLEENAVEVLLDTAFKEDADLVAGGYSQFNENGIINTVTYGVAPQKVSASTIPGYTCMKAFRAELLQNFCFPEGMLFEDTVLPRLIFPLCKKAYTVPSVVYHYRMHSNAFSSSHHQQTKGLDTYWITKYCLEEAVKRGYALDGDMYEQYLQQCWVNFLRTQYLSGEIQEALFVLTADLLLTHFKGIPAKGKYKLLDKAFKRKSYAAYRFLMQRWERF